eukprot:GHVO01005012.1.p1 GENE.GHVO01005012.1~~GHVO01005012.1.p1  ORF type:complete len:423 (-),score=31.22 GHVO01005012.1:5-1273(-)
MSVTENDQNGAAVPVQHAAQPAVQQPAQHPVLAALKPPAAMNVSGDVASNWTIFRENYEDWAIAAGVRHQTMEVQLATLRTVMGRECKNILRHLPLTDVQLASVDEIMDGLQGHFYPRTNVVHERYLFRCATQSENEQFDAYLSKLRKLSSSCQYGTLQDEMIRDNIIFGCREDSLRKKLLSEEQLTLERTIQICRSTELAAKHFSAMQSATATVHAVQGRPIKKNFKQIQSKPVRTTSQKQNGKDEEHAITCRFCGMKHAKDRNACPAYGKECRSCKRLNHFAKCCKTKPIHNVRNENESTQDETDLDVCYSLGRKKYVVNIAFGQKTVVKCQVDTGASRNIMPLKDYVQIKPWPNDELKDETVSLRTYSGTAVKPMGSDILQARVNDKTYRLSVLIVKEGPVSLLSGMTAEKMGLINVTF